MLVSYRTISERVEVCFFNIVLIAAALILAYLYDFAT